MQLIWSTPEIDSFSEVELDKLLHHLSENGFSGIEPIFSGTPQLEIKILKQLLDNHKQKIIGLRTGGITLKHEVSFSHPDENIREQAINYFKEAIQYGSDVGASLLLTGLIQGKISPSWSFQDARKNIHKCLVACANEAQKFGSEIDLEAVNHFELGYHSKAQEVIEFIKQINQPNVKLLLDTFHMNMEERCIEETLILSAPYLSHMHFADNNRRIPGRGSIDFRRIVRTLQALNYQGCISIESNDEDWEAAIMESANYLLPMLNS